MKKKILSILTIILMISMLVLLTGCGDDSEKSDDNKKSSTPKETIKEFLGYIEDAKFDKAFKYVEWPLEYMRYMDINDYEEIDEMSSKEIRKFENDKESSIESRKKMIKTYEAFFKSYEEFKINADVGKAEKVEDTKNIYEVEVDIEIEYQKGKLDDEKSKTKTFNFYLIKDDGEYKIIEGLDKLRALFSDVNYAL